MTVKERWRGGLCCAVLMILLSGVSTRSSAAVDPLWTSDGAVLIRGYISDETADAFDLTLAQTPITRVMLDSPGGSVVPAMRIARQIHRRRLDVEVVGDCMSSCANYLFVAGDKKTITGQGIVAWHGNAHHLLYQLQQKDAPPSPILVAAIQAIARDEASFFEEVGVDQMLCWFGKLPPYDVYNLYFLSVEDMAFFGINQVTAPVDYGQDAVSRFESYGPKTLTAVRVDRTNVAHPALPL